MSEHLGVANITLETASFKSMGQFLKTFGGKKNKNEINAVKIHNHDEQTNRLQDQSFQKEKFKCLYSFTQTRSKQKIQ